MMDFLIDVLILCNQIARLTVPEWLIALIGVIVGGLIAVILDLIKFRRDEKQKGRVLMHVLMDELSSNDLIIDRNILILNKSREVLRACLKVSSSAKPYTIPLSPLRNQAWDLTIRILPKSLAQENEILRSIAAMSYVTIEINTLIDGRKSFLEAGLADERDCSTFMDYDESIGTMLTRLQKENLELGRMYFRKEE